MPPTWAIPVFRVEPFYEDRPTPHVCRREEIVFELQPELCPGRKDNPRDFENQKPVYVERA
jgi:hypothetical protein